VRRQIFSGPFHAKCADGSLDILEGEVTQGMERDLEPPGDSLSHGTRNNDPARRCVGLQPSRHIYRVALNVISIEDDIPQVKANPEHDGFILGFIVIGVDHGLLEIYGCRECVNGAGELDQAPVAL
jgi:hypothetical protein